MENLTEWILSLSAFQLKSARNFMGIATHFLTKLLIDRRIVPTIASLHEWQHRNVVRQEPFALGLGNA
jgi:hypothetical protein